MKALSVRQLWAHSIIYLDKDHENRNWQTRVRGRVGIHAAKGMSWDEYQEAAAFIRDIHLDAPLPAFDDVILGAMIGSVEIIDCVRRSNSPWFVGDYGFVLKDPRPLREPVPCRGALNFWDIPEDVVEMCRKLRAA